MADDSFFNTSEFEMAQDGSESISHIFEELNTSKQAHTTNSTMENLEMRKKSLPPNWQNTSLGNEMAENGFYHVGIHDWTQCYSCGKIQNNWNLRESVVDPSLHEINCQHFLRHCQMQMDACSTSAVQSGINFANLKKLLPDTSWKNMLGCSLLNGIIDFSCFSSQQNAIEDNGMLADLEPPGTTEIDRPPDTTELEVPLGSGSVQNERSQLEHPADAKAFNDEFDNVDEDATSA